MMSKHCSVCNFTSETFHCKQNGDGGVPDNRDSRDPNVFCSSLLCINMGQIQLLTTEQYYYYYSKMTLEWKQLMSFSMKDD